MASSKKRKRETQAEIAPLPAPNPVPLIQVIIDPNATLLQAAAAFAAIQDGQIIYGRAGIGWCASDPPTADGQKPAWDAVAKKVVWVNV